MKYSATDVGDLVALGARRHPARVALRDSSGRERRYAELDERTTRLANALIGLGLTRGDRIAAWMSDSFEYVEVYLAAAKAGLIVCPINSRLVAAEAVHLLSDAGARALIWSPDLDEKVAELDVGVWDDLIPVCTAATSVRAALDYETILSGAATGFPGALPVPEDVLILGYTSGTSGRPKGAMLTHGGIVSIARQNAFAFRLSAYPEWALTGSMAFVSVVPAHVLCALRMGGTVNIMGKWDPDSLLHLIRTRRANFAYIPSPLLQDVTQRLDRDRAAWASLTSVLHSASKADPAHLAALHAVVGTRLVEGWGMTEHSGGLATATSSNDYLDVGPRAEIFGTVGRAATDVDIRVVDEAGDELPHDGETLGELLIASPALMSGYWGDTGATDAVLRDGWYRTGDIGSISADGYVRISERRTDLIVSGGANVYPTEVELCIAGIPGVREVAVVGAPHPRWGQSVIAMVVRDAGAGVTEQLVVERCRQQLAGFKKPSRVFFLDALPRTTSLKVARGELRQHAAELVAAHGYRDS